MGERVAHEVRNVLACMVENVFLSTGVVLDEGRDVVDVVVVDNPAGVFGLVRLDLLHRIFLLSHRGRSSCLSNWAEGSWFLVWCC